MRKISFRVRYTIALTLVALFSLLFYSNTILLIKDQARYAEIINLSGKERMLVAKMLLYADEFAYHKVPRYKELLQAMTAEFEQTEQNLKGKGYIFEQPGKTQLLNDIRHLLTLTQDQDTDVFEKKHEFLIEKIDVFVLSVQKESERNALNIERIETVLLLLFLLLLLVEAYFIFLPAEREIRSKTRELTDINRDLERRITQEVKKGKEQTSHMLQQSRLAQMGEMISMIAHQWRQPLSSISAIAGTLSMDTMTGTYKKEFFQERLQDITDLSQHLSLTIDDFRNFFKAAKEREMTTWEQMVGGSLKIIGPTLATKNITVHTAFEQHEAIDTYPNEVKQVILNIIKNAEDILLEKEVADAQIWIKSYAAEEAACLSIEDNAGGIPETIIGRIFDPYFSTKEQKEGTGLGLYMSKIIIEEHCKGTLAVRNSKNGARFEIALYPKQKRKY